MKDETNLARIPSLLSKFSHSSFLGRLALVDQAGGELDAEGFNGWAVLHDDHGADGLAGVLENGHDGDGVDACGLASLACGGFPDALFAVLRVDCVSTWNMLVKRKCHSCCVPGQTTSTMSVTDYFRIKALGIYLDLPQLGPFGLVCTERANAVDLRCLRHREGASRACGSGECGIEMVNSTKKTHG
jgi:hypothetical protein